MKIYLLVEENDYWPTTIVGAFSSRAGASGAIPYQEFQLDERNIMELDLDPPHSGAKHHSGFYFGVSADGRTWEGQQWMLEAAAPKLVYMWESGSGEQVGQATASAHTKEEAEQMARVGITQLDPIWQVGRCRGSGVLMEIRHPHPSAVHRWETLSEPAPYAVHRELGVARTAFHDYETSGLGSAYLVAP